jgi:membrane protease YdiL (CAAX protease family)
VPEWSHLLAFLACVGTVAIGATVAAWFLGAFRGTVQGPPRIEPQASVWPMFLAIAAAFAGLFAGGTIAALLVRIVDGQELFDQILRPPSAVDGNSDVAAEVVVRRMQLSAASYVFAMSGALLTLWTARRLGWRGGIGAGEQLLARGVLYGLLAALLVIPWMMTASILFQAVLKALDVQVDAMHELIRAIRDHAETQLILWGLFSATILAPLAEEVLFRGVLQTALVTAWARIFEPHAREEGRGFDVVMPVVPTASPPSMSGTWAGPADPMARPTALAQPGATATATHPPRYLALPASPPIPVRYRPSALGRWVAISLTSVLFAALHEPWSIPLIFLLSLALGYLYERTGNLWTCIALHFAFNSFNMLLILPFLLQ